MTNRTDNFNRATGPIGTPSDGGSAWIQQSGQWIVGATTEANQAKLNDAAPQATCVLESSVSDVDVQVTFANVASSSDLGIVFRSSDDNNYLLAAIDGSGGTAIRIFKKVAGSYTQLGTTGTAFASSGDVWKVRANGSSITVYQNGVSVRTVTDSTFITNTKHGIRSHGDTAALFDDFSITSLAASFKAAWAVNSNFASTSGAKTT